MAGKTYRWTADKRPEVEAALRSSSTRREAATKLKVSMASLDFACDVYGLEAQGLLRVAPSPETAPEETENRILRRRIETLTADLKTANARVLTDEFVKREILGLKKLGPDIPEWTVRPMKKSKAPGVPSIFTSDIHAAEVVDPAQIEGSNEYDPDIMERRMRTLTEGTIELLTEHVVHPEYPGIVMVNAGDDFSGSIHFELERTNAMDPAPAFMRMLGIRIRQVKALRDAFGRVFFVGVPGNHGRLDDKVPAKGFAHRNWDWLEYQMLRLHFEEDERVSFYIPDGSDALFRIFGHRYLLTHGNQFRGGDGIIGPLGPLTRGDNKKRARNVLLGSEYDTLLVGHFHRLMLMRHMIVNGSVKGYDEYAYQGNFPFEPPMQALWLTHPDHGITISMPVFLEPKKRTAPGAWVEWRDQRAA